MAKLEKYLTRFLENSSNPKIAFYNAGSDVYQFDSLGQLSISAKGIFERDKFVFDILTNANIPWVMVLSGGYTKESYKLIAQSIIYVLKTWGVE